MAEQQIYFAFFYTTGYKTSLITVQKAHRDGFYINICNNILSVHGNVPMIASMPSCFDILV